MTGPTSYRQLLVALCEELRADDLDSSVLSSIIVGHRDAGILPREVLILETVRVLVRKDGDLKQLRIRLNDLTTLRKLQHPRKVHS